MNPHRDRDAVVDHVLNAELAYARKIGVKVAPPRSRMRCARSGSSCWQRCALPGFRACLPRHRGGRAKGWPPPYAARRIGWHALDHVWEIEDRSDPPG